MPRCLEPGQKFPVVLEGDKGKGSEPTFWFRSVPVRALIKAQNDAEDPKVGSLSAASAFLKSALVGWDNLTGLDGEPIPFSVDELDNVVDDGELIELFHGFQVSARDKKKSE